MRSLSLKQNLGCNKQKAATLIFHRNNLGTEAKIRFTNTSELTTKKTALQSEVRELENKSRIGKIFAVSDWNPRLPDLTSHDPPSPPRTLKTSQTLAKNKAENIFFKIAKTKDRDYSKTANKEGFLFES